MTGKIALVTGGTRGIGREICRSLAEAGCRVAFTYHTRYDLAHGLEEQLKDSGSEARTYQLSLGDRRGLQTVLSRIREELGEVQILVNNAAMAHEVPFESITDADWDRMMAVNLRGVFAASQEVLPAMVEAGWGRIVNLTSIGGQWGGVNQVHYAASKAALINFTHSLARIHSRHGITSNAVAAGLVRTEMTERELNSEAGQEKVLAIPAGRIGTVAEVAATVLFLASEEAGYITGQTINVNGGMLFS